MGEPSRNAVAWFGRADNETKVWDYILRQDERLRDWFVLGFEQLVAGILSFEAAAEQIPKEIRYEDRTYALTFRPVLVENELGVWIEAPGDPFLNPDRRFVLWDLVERVCRIRSADRIAGTAKVPHQAFHAQQYRELDQRNVKSSRMASTSASIQ